MHRVLQENWALFAKPTCALFSFLCWSSLLEIHIISNYKGLLQSDEICNKEKKEKNAPEIFFGLWKTIY